MSRERPFSNDPGKIWRYPEPLGSDVIEVTTNNSGRVLQEVIVDNAGVRSTYRKGLRCVMWNPYREMLIIYFTNPNGRIQSATYRTDLVTSATIIVRDSISKD